MLIFAVLCTVPGIQQVPYKFTSVPKGLFCFILNTTLGDAEQHSLSFTGRETVAQRLRWTVHAGQWAELPGDAGLRPASLCLSTVLYTASGHGPLHFSRVAKHVSGI